MVLWGDFGMRLTYKLKKVEDGWITILINF